MRHILPFLSAFLVCTGLVAAAIPVSKLNVEYVRSFGGGEVTVLAATDKLLFVSDAEQLNGPGVSRLLVCDRLTGEIVHEFRSPFSRRRRVSDFEIPLTSPPVLLDDGFVYLDADWHLCRIKLPPAGGQPIEVWNLDIPEATHLTPRLNDDIGYLLPIVTHCGDALLFTFNSAPSGAVVPVHTTMIAVNAADGKLRWVRTLGPAGPCDRSPTCVSNGTRSFCVVTATGDLQTFSLIGDLKHAFRPSGEFRPSGNGSPWFGEVGDLWELSRVDKTKLLVFAGQHVESEGKKPFPLCCVEAGADGSMKLLWQTTKPRGSVAAPAVGTNLYLRSAKTLTALALDSGKELWTHDEEDDAGNYGFLPPVVHAGVVYFVSLDGLRLFRDDSRGFLMQTVEFSEEMLSMYTPPVIHGDTLYVAAGEKIYAIKLPIAP